MTLTAANRAALEHARAAALRERARHRARIARLTSTGIDELAAALRRARLTINFHPDRVIADGRSVAEALRDEGVYRSQFETRISAGGLTAFPGGDRDRWEHELFGGAYDGARESERPKYGGLNVLLHRNGACPAFGSCHLRLRPALLERTTLIFGDSVWQRSEVAVADVLEPVLAPLLECDWFTLSPTPAMSRSLEDYVEAQVHGPLVLDTDVEAVVIDPAFAGTATGERLLAAAERHGFAAEWRPARVLPLARVPLEAPADISEPRLWKELCAGGRARALAERVTGGAPLDAANIGAAAVAAARDPETLQHLKYLWRMVVAWGEP